MAKGVNKVLLLGNVGKDPEIRSTAGGMTVASFSLATADRAKDAQGNWADKTEWHNLVCFQRTAEVVRDYVKKGHPDLRRRQDPDSLLGRQDQRRKEIQNRNPRQRANPTRRRPGQVRRRLLRQLLQSWFLQLRLKRSSQPARLRRPGHHRRRHPLLTFTNLGAPFMRRYRMSGHSRSEPLYAALTIATNLTSTAYTH